MLIAEYLAYAIVGILAGTLAGLLGISGGIVTIPCLVLIFHLLDFPSVYIMQLAIGTSLAAMVFNAIASTWSHHMHGGVMWDVVKKMTLGMIIGGIIGAFIGDNLPTAILELIFGVFAILIGVHLYRQKEIFEGTQTFPDKGKMNLWSVSIGALSTILGVGGGSMTVPLFVHFKMPMKKAVGTSAATGVVITLIGAISYLIFGLDEAFYSKSAGYIYLPAFAVLAVTTFFAAPLGVRLTYKVSAKRLKKIFGIVLVITGIAMMIR